MRSGASHQPAAFHERINPSPHSCSIVRARRSATPRGRAPSELPSRYTTSAGTTKRSRAKASGSAASRATASSREAGTGGATSPLTDPARAVVPSGVAGTGGGTLPVTEPALPAAGSGRGDGRRGFPGGRRRDSSWSDWRASAELAADDRDEAHTRARRAAEVVGEGLVLGVHALDLPRLGGLVTQLQPGLEQHAEAGGADRMAEALQAAVGVDRELTI